MKGKVATIIPGSCLFVKPEDGSEDVYLGLKRFPEANILIKGDELEFEIDPTPPRKKGDKRRVSSIRLVKSGAPTAAAAKSGTKPNSSTSATPVVLAKPLEIEADPAVDPDGSGGFAVMIATRNIRGKLASRKFRAVCISPVKKFQLWIILADGTNVSSPTPDFETPTNGYLNLYLTFEGEIATVKFVLDNGQFAIVDFVK